MVNIKILIYYFNSGKLNCLRKNPKIKQHETLAEKDLREKANWNSDCSFESESESIK